MHADGIADCPGVGARGPMLKLIEARLNSVRGATEHVAKHSDGDFLLYLLEMALLEVKRQTHARKGISTPVQGCLDDAAQHSDNAA